MSAESWKEYQEFRKTVSYLEKKYGEKEFYEIMRKISKLRKQGVDVEALFDNAMSAAR